MAGHFPFSGRGGRASTNAFFEAEGLNEDLQEKYYQWWYNQAKEMVENDPELKVTKAHEFKEYPFGQHAHHNFHLNDKAWAVALADLGDFLKGVVFPRLSEEAMHKLEEEHKKMVESLRKEAEANPREAAPDIGFFRHT